MKTTIVKLNLTILVLAGLFIASCKEGSKKQSRAIVTATSTVDANLNEDSIIYKTGNLTIRRLSKHVYQHTSFLNTEDFGRVACNGMLVVNENQAVIFDTPADNESSGELINYVTRNLKSKITAIIPTHFHEDCVAGLEKFNEYHIPSYGSNKTIKLLKNKGNKYAALIKGFDDSLTLNIGDKKLYAEYFGEGHTKDNIIGYFPVDNAIFGGCLIKELGANKGNLGDANIKEWPQAVQKLKQKYPQANIVIPGHGKSGGTELFDYTIKLFK